MRGSDNCKEQCNQSRDARKRAAKARTPHCVVREGVEQGSTRGGEKERREGESSFWSDSQHFGPLVRLNTT
jgi:hypothetical protein